MMKIAVFQLTRIGIVLEPAEADEHVAGLGPGRFEVPVARRQRLSFRLADLVDMDLAVAVIRNPGGARRAGLAGAGEQRRERRAQAGGGRDATVACVAWSGTHVGTVDRCVISWRCVSCGSSELAAEQATFYCARVPVCRDLYPFVSAWTKCRAADAGCSGNVQRRRRKTGSFNAGPAAGVQGDSGQSACARERSIPGPQKARDRDWDRRSSRSVYPGQQAGPPALR